MFVSHWPKLFNVKTKNGFAGFYIIIRVSEHYNNYTNINAQNVHVQSQVNNNIAISIFLASIYILTCDTERPIKRTVEIIIIVYFS